MLALAEYPDAQGSIPRRRRCWTTSTRRLSTSTAPTTRRTRARSSRRSATTSSAWASRCSAAVASGIPLALEQLAERRERLVRRRRGGVFLAAATRFRVFHAGVLVLVAVDAQQFPVRAVGRIVVVVAVLVVHGQLAQPRAGEFACATHADPRQDLERRFAVGRFLHGPTCARRAPRSRAAP